MLVRYLGVVLVVDRGDAVDVVDGNVGCTGFAAAC